MYDKLLLTVKVWTTGSCLYVILLLSNFCLLYCILMNLAQTFFKQRDLSNTYWVSYRHVARHLHLRVHEQSLTLQSQSIAFVPPPILSALPPPSKEQVHLNSCGAGFGFSGLSSSSSSSASSAGTGAPSHVLQIGQDDGWLVGNG